MWFNGEDSVPFVMQSPARQIWKGVSDSIALHKHKHGFPTVFLTRSFTKDSCRKKAAKGQEWKWCYKLMIIFKKEMKQKVGVSDRFSLVKGDHK